MKGTDSLGSIDFHDLWVQPSLKFASKFRCPDFEKYDRKVCPYNQLKLYGVAMAQYDRKPRGEKNWGFVQPNKKEMILNFKVKLEEKFEATPS